MERRVVKDIASGGRQAASASSRHRSEQDTVPPIGIEPGRFHEFVAALSYYVVEQQRKLHNQEWNEEEVQVRFYDFVICTSKYQTGLIPAV